MTEYINSTLRSNDWGLYFTSPTYRECLVIFIILFYGLRIQIQKLNHQRHINLIKEFEKSIVQILATLVDWCTFMMDYDDIIEKEVTNARVLPYKNETITKPERKEESKHPWDIAQEIIAEQNQAALVVKWGILPLETLMDEQFLSILHAVEEITDVTPLREAAIQLPKKIYEIVGQYEQLKEVPAELTDQLIFNISKTYFYFVIESLCRLIKTIQQGQRTSLISQYINQMESLTKEDKLMLRQADELIETKFLNKTTKKKRNKRFGLAGWIMGWGIGHLSSFRAIKNNIRTLQLQNRLQEDQILELAHYLNITYAHVSTNRYAITHLQVQLAQFNKILIATLEDAKFIKYTIAVITDIRIILAKLTLGVMSLNKMSMLSMST